MELTFTWYWIVQVVAFIVALSTISMAFKHKFSSTFWNIIALVAIILAIVSPVKIDGTDNAQYMPQQESTIASTKALLEKTIADNWEKITVEGTNKEDLK